MRKWAISCWGGQVVALCAFLLLTLPAAARGRPQAVGQSGGQVAESSVGKAGQRQTREQSPANIAPMGRIDNRIGNRVQNRLRNRIGRSYDPSANATSPFATAADQVRKNPAQKP